MSDRKNAKLALSKLMVASAILASATTQDADPLWDEVEASLERMDRKDRKPSEPVVRGRAG